MPAAGRPSDQDTGPRPPFFTARTDRVTGVVCTQGHLDPVGAEALCRTVTALQHLNHRQIVVRLEPLTQVDDRARTILAEHARRLRTEGVRLLLR